MKRKVSLLLFLENKETRLLVVIKKGRKETHALICFPMYKKIVKSQ